MNDEMINKQVGSLETRNEKTSELATELADFLIQNGYKKVSCQPQSTVENHHKQNSTPTIQYRAKTNESITKKINQFNEPLNEVLDLYGIRLVVSDEQELNKISNLIWQHLWQEPLKKETTIRNGTMYFSPFRDYRKRDWQGVGPATSGGYDTAIHLNRKTKYGIAEIQIMTADLYKRYFDPSSEENHDLFKQRQEKIRTPK